MFFICLINWQVLPKEGHVFVVLRYFEGECKVFGPFDTEDAAYVYIGRAKNFDSIRGKGSFGVRPIKGVE
jgi:hypothetical protein